MNELHLPFALDANGKLISPTADVEPAERWCCECRAPLLWTKAHTRSGIEVRAYFSHKPDASCSATGESYAHLAAKIRIREQVSSAIAGVGPWPTLWLMCKCGDRRTLGMPLEGIAKSVVTERNLGHVNLRPDVTVRNVEGSDVFAIEVVHTNPISAAKIASIGLPWVEVGTEGFDHASTVWPARRIGFCAEACEQCMRIERKAQEERARAAELMRKAEQARAERERKAQEERNRVELEKQKDRDRINAAHAAWVAAQPERYAEQARLDAQRKSECEAQTVARNAASEAARIASLKLLAYTPDEAKREWIARGAMLVECKLDAETERRFPFLRHNGAIVTHLNQNTKVFRDRMYAAIALGFVPPTTKANHA